MSRFAVILITVVGVSFSGCERVPNTPPLTVAQLQAVVPGLSSTQAAQLLRVMAASGITTRQRQAAFLSQIAAESNVRPIVEKWSAKPNFPLPGVDREPYTATSAEDYFNYWYGNRPDLGNTQAGDGYRFRGRGYIQLTGRANYVAAGTALGIDLVGNPDLATNPDVAWGIAAWYWSNRRLNALADQGNIRAITVAVNGSDQQWQFRLAAYQRTLRLLGN